MQKLKVAVVGGGGRENAIVLKLKESKKIEKLYCIPGNAGISQIAECVPIGVMDFEKIGEFAINNKLDLVFVAPDDPLAKGLVDYLESLNIRAFGPNKSAARLEGSKIFSKNFMKKYGIPTATYETFDCYEKAEEYLKTADMPIVLKADGLALGKGVLICKDRDEALLGLKSLMIDGNYGKEAGSKIVVEEFLEGREVTLLTFCDGNTIIAMPSSQDHKRAFDGDKGLNTGGMGAFAPSPYFTNELEYEFFEKIAGPTLNGLKKEDITFKGVIYFGLMITKNGLKVIEYNARFGDPETQVILPLLKTDLLDVVNACIDGTLDSLDIEWKDGSALTVVIAEGGYPDKVIKGHRIEIGDLDGVTLYHAGTKFNEKGELVTNGGRVFTMTAVGKNIDDARKIVYSQIDKVKFESARYRKDIGLV